MNVLPAAAVEKICSHATYDSFIMFYTVFVQIALWCQVYLEHDPQHEHVVRVPGIAQLIEDGLLEDGGEVVRVGATQIFEAGEEQCYRLLGLQSLLDQ